MGRKLFCIEMKLVSGASRTFRYCLWTWLDDGTLAIQDSEGNPEMFRMKDISELSIMPEELQ